MSYPVGRVKIYTFGICMGTYICLWEATISTGFKIHTCCFWNVWRYLLSTVSSTHYYCCGIVSQQSNYCDFLHSSWYKINGIIMPVTHSATILRVTTNFTITRSNFSCHKYYNVIQNHVAYEKQK